MFTLITPTQGNVTALKRTIDSLKGLIDEVVIGDLSVFQEDSDAIRRFQYVETIKVVPMPFDFLFKNGFSAALNLLASFAKNDMILYLNVGEVLASDVNETINKVSPSYTCYYIDHATDPHHWYRVYNRKEIAWGGIIHEEIYGNLKPCSVPLFRFEDTPKDSEDPFKEWVYLQIKEVVYWNLYIKLVDQPHLAQGTNPGWIQFSRDGFTSFVDRLHQKGEMYDAFLLGDKELLMKYINEKKETF